MRDGMATEDVYRTHFIRHAEQLAQHGSAWTRPVRQEAFARFAALGFPSTREEDWKYTNLAPMTKIPFTPTDNASSEGREDIRALHRRGQMEGPQLVFVNGHYTPGLSTPHGLPGGVTVCSLAQALRTHRHQVEPHLARYASFQQHAFVALNTAFMQDGVFLHVPPETIVETPISVVFVSTAPSEAVVSYPRNLMVLEQGSHATLVERYVGVASDVYLTNAVTEVVAGEHAMLDHYWWQQESTTAFHMARLQVQQAQNSSVTSHAFTLGGALVRHEVQAMLVGEGSECTLNGLFMAAGQQHVDNQTRIEHVKPHCASRELYKGILNGQGRGVFNGTIYVHKEAQKTNAQQTNKNLLLSPEAWIDTKPQLEIYNNDVKCGHGSTIGRLDDVALFYLRSRGIGLAEARGLLTYAFASEMLNRITLAPLHAALHDSVYTWLQTPFEVGTPHIAGHD